MDENILETTFVNLFGKYETEITYNFEINNDILKKYVILPSTFVKMLTFYIEKHIGFYSFNKIIKFVRDHYDIKSKFTFTKYQMSRLILEVLFERQKTSELDLLFEQLKIFGNYIFENNTLYSEVIDNVNNSIKKDNFHTEEIIKELNKKIKFEKIKLQTAIINNHTYLQTMHENEIEKLNVKIKKHTLSLKTHSYEEIDTLIYDKVKNFCYRISDQYKQIIIKKVLEYLNDIKQYDTVFRPLTDFNKSNGSSLGKTYETHIYNYLKPILNNIGFEIINNVEFDLLNGRTGVKLEHDFLIGKIINNTFILYGVFDAKLSKALIINDIDKFSHSIDLIYKNQLYMTLKSKRQYYKLFNKIQTVDNKIMMGYFCQTNINQEKETSKAISKFLIKKSIELFETINGAFINLESISDQLMSNIDLNNSKIINAFNINKPYIYTVIDNQL